MENYMRSDVSYASFQPNLWKNLPTCMVLSYRHHLKLKALISFIADRSRLPFFFYTQNHLCKECFFYNYI